MAKGFFSPLLVPEAWFSPLVEGEGWFDEMLVDGAPAAPETLYKGAKTRAQFYLGVRSDADLYKGTKQLFPA